MDAPTISWLVVNRASGSHDEALVEDLAGVLAGPSGKQVKVIDCRDGACPDAARATEAGIDRVAVLGGDGTLNSVLLGLEGWGGSVLPLPGGTANLLCKGLFGSIDARAVAERFAAGELVPRRVPVIRGPRSAALVELLSGPGAKWADVREDMREGEVSAMIEDAIAATGEAASGPLALVADPVIGRRDGYPGIRLSCGSNGIRVQGYGGEGFVDFLRQGMAIIGRDFRDGPHDELGEHPTVTIAMEDGSPVELMVDGERAVGSPRETFRLAELDLDLLGPPA